MEDVLEQAMSEENQLRYRVSQLKDLVRDMRQVLGDVTPNFDRESYEEWLGDIDRRIEEAWS